jgi:UDP-glucuronate 4-epimerase
MKIMVTGTAGFIGFHLAERLLAEGHEVVGLDVINDYYDPKLKLDRLAQHGIDLSGTGDESAKHGIDLSGTGGEPAKHGIDPIHMSGTGVQTSSLHSRYQFWQVDLAEHDRIVHFMQAERFDAVVHLAAQAGVRYSLENPRAYTHANIDGFLSILEGCRQSQTGHLIFASTSSVYGLNTRMPLSEDHPTEHPMALYAATKKANELMAHSYSHLFRMPVTGLRFFTVYGPWGRPDMALFLFTDAILNDRPIQVFNNGDMIRDFTYVGDIVESIARLVHHPAQPNPAWDGQNPHIPTSTAPYRIYNIGNSAPVPLHEYIEAIEEALGKKAIRQYLPMQPGDVPATHADTHALYDLVGFRPATQVRDGVARFVEWYRQYYRR